ncbi:sensor histidine kinase [Parashewanella spongiae]|uniref:Sensor histidine kinase n=1 Tax=Parashewanella spongiae TaxID=342950 RepID=A0A3A6TLF0_9GAMM|nr:histidine kinase [Parashewanella spongiae]MCL1078815.1 histidine kinase [Parashewanella spongiae]RJY11905.1 sensor histidine kinase [Parashewanella spongiae]
MTASQLNSAQSCVKTPSSRKKLEDRFAWVYLCNLVFYFIPMFIASMAAWEIITSLVVLAAFLPLYFWAHRCTSIQAKYPIALIFILSVGVTPLNSGSLALFTYVAFYCGFHYRIPKTLWLWAGQIATLIALNLLLGFPNPYFALWGAGLTIGIGLIGLAARKREEHFRAEQQSRAEIKTLATMVERERIARDLHDVMGHSLSSISLKAELASKLIESNQLETAKQHLDELAQISRESLSQLRQTVSNYKHKGLSSTVTELCQSLRDKSLSVTLVGELPKTLNAMQESHLTLILTELCNNILRHSKAEECEFNFIEHSDNFVITLTENVSYSDKATESFNEGNGLTGIRERLQDIDGQFYYQLHPQLMFTIELPKQDKDVNHD